MKFGILKKNKTFLAGGKGPSWTGQFSAKGQPRACLQCANQCTQSQTSSLARLPTQDTAFLSLICPRARGPAAGDTASFAQSLAEMICAALPFPRNCMKLWLRLSPLPPAHPGPSCGPMSGLSLLSQGHGKILDCVFLGFSCVSAGGRT